MSLNSVAISGNLTRDPELRQTPGGTQVLSFGVAVNERRKNASGEWEDAPNFVDCTMFGTRAEKLSGYLHKGTKVAVSGRLRYSSWEHDGQKRSKLEVVADNLEFMSPRQAQDGSGAPQSRVMGNQPPARKTAPQNVSQKPTEPQQTQADLYDEDIPF